jgi:hypothetical protein
LILDPQGEKTDDVHAPRISQAFQCELCNSGSISGIYLIPLSFRGLEESVELRKAAALNDLNNKSISSPAGQGVKRNWEDDEDADADFEAESSYVVFSQGRQTLSSGLADSDSQRTGRWTDEEVSFVDHLVSSFDQGHLPLPYGSKLSNFLGDLLLCKSSRLTKKMKNAKLSTRAFELASPNGSAVNREDCEVLSVLQERFIMTMPSENSQLELRFNIRKQWRTYFSNLCVQVGYPYLDGGDWIASLEEFERLASSAEEKMRNVRRRRMGFSLRGSLPAPSGANDTKVTPRTISTHDFPMAPDHTDGTEGQTQNDGTLAFYTDSPPRTISQQSLTKRPRAYSDDLDSTFMELMGSGAKTDEAGTITVNNSNSSLSGIFPPATQSSDPFLEAIAMYLEKYNLPFQHADVWVPSFIQDNESEESVRLLHAGHVTRGDQDEQLWSAFQQFGEYSKSFSFKPGQGLPGRVYSSGKASWEFQVNELNPSSFHRVGGANEYGIRTAIAIPFSTPGVGRMVVVLYSSNHIAEDNDLAHRCIQELSQYSPEPKWKLVIEIGDNCCCPVPLKNATASSAATDALDFVNHSSVKSFTQEDRQSLSPRTLGVTEQAEPSNVLAPSGEGVDIELQRIISLLGEQLGLDDGVPAGESTFSSIYASNLSPQFMTIRLMLLRPEGRRSDEENEMIDILKCSFKAYSDGNMRSGTELAGLLAREWLCLKTAFTCASDSRTAEQPLPPTTPSADVHKSHQLMPVLSPAGMSASLGMAAPPSCIPVGSPASTFVLKNDHYIGEGNKSPLNLMRRTISCPKL